jgi:hypothetical protein
MNYERWDDEMVVTIQTGSDLYLYRMEVLNDKLGYWD